MHPIHNKCHSEYLVLSVTFTVTIRWCAKIMKLLKTLQLYTIYTDNYDDQVLMVNTKWYEYWLQFILQYNNTYTNTKSKASTFEFSVYFFGNQTTFNTNERPLISFHIGHDTLDTESSPTNCEHGNGGTFTASRPRVSPLSLWAKLAPSSVYTFQKIYWGIFGALKIMN